MSIIEGKLKAAIYARVSTEEQVLDNQLGSLKAWAEHLNLEVVAIYQEKESAWKAGQQTELKNLVADAQRGKFKVLLTWALDRISREGALTILQFVNKIQSWGCRIYSYQEPWTLAPGELAELLYALTAWVARMESQRRSERTKAGIETKRKSGWRPGRPLGSRDTKIRKRRSYAKGYIWSYKKGALNFTPGLLNVNAGS